MTTTNFNWSVKQLRVLPEAEGNQNVVVEMEVMVIATQGENELVFPQTVSLQFDGSKPFVPLDQLTEAQAIQWAKDSYGSNLQPTLDRWENQIEMLKLKKAKAPVAVVAPWAPKEA